MPKTLIAHGKVERGWLGVTIRGLTPELAKSIHAENLKGALVADVTKGGPAEKAGLKKNDLIIAYRGKEISDSDELRNAVAETPIGTEVKITVFREGKKEELTVKIGSLEEATKILAASVKERLGVEVKSPNSLEVQQIRSQSPSGGCDYVGGSEGSPQGSRFRDRRYDPCHQ